jgi:4-amino-4-deoxy-L-arabinose transferase-like glycosyltransferase
VARARAASALWVALAAGLTFAAVRRLRGRSDLALVAGLGVGLWPQATFVGAYANDDALAILAGSALLYALVAIEKDGTTARRAALLGVALGLTALSKYTAYAAFPLALLWGIRQARREGPRFVRGAAAGTGIGVLLSGWWFVRNALLYDGDVLGLRFAGRRVAEFAASLPDGLAARTRLLAAGSLRARGAPPASVLDHDWLGLTFGSFFGRFGWMSRPLPAAVYVLAAALFVLAAAGVPRRRARDEDAEPSLAVTLLGPAFLFLLLLTSLANSYLVDWQPQGRYLLPCLPGLWAFMVDAAVRQAPPVGKIFPWLLLALVAAANLLAWGFFLRPG